MCRLSIAARLFGSWPMPCSSKRATGASITLGGVKRSSSPPPGFAIRAGWDSNHAWVAAPRGRREASRPAPAGLRDPRRLELEPRLVRGDLDGLRGPGGLRRFHEAL